MKRLFLFLGIILSAGLAHAFTPDEFAYVPNSSYTDVGTGGNMMFSSAPIRIVGVTISSPAATGGSFLAIYRSTTAVWTPDISTQALIVTDFYGSNAGPVYIDLFGITNTSYTHINKAGNAKVIIWVQCVKENLKLFQPYYGFCPGLPYSGQVGAPMMRLGD